MGPAQCHLGVCSGTGCTQHLKCRGDAVAKRKGTSSKGKILQQAKKLGGGSLQARSPRSCARSSRVRPVARLPCVLSAWKCVCVCGRDRPCVWRMATAQNILPFPFFGSPKQALWLWLLSSPSFLLVRPLVVRGTRAGAGEQYHASTQRIATGSRRNNKQDRRVGGCGGGGVLPCLALEDQRATCRESIQGCSTQRPAAGPPFLFRPCPSCLQLLFNHF